MNRIKDVLKEQGRSQKFLADKLGKSYNMVNLYVRNVNQPSLDILNQVAVILEVSVKDLIIDNRE